MPVALVVAASSPPSLQPRPIGLGPRYHPPAAPPAVLAARPVGRLRCRHESSDRFGVHIELFARRQVVIVPAGIGVARPFRRSHARVIPSGCTYPVRTIDPTGVVEVRAGTRATLGDFFRVWGQPLGRRRLASFRAGMPVLAFVNGRRRPGDARAIPLTRHAEIVLEIGGYVAPHASYLFRGGL